MGVDNTGSKNVADDIQTIVNSGTYGVYFPAGVYLIDKPVEFRITLIIHIALSLMLTHILWLPLVWMQCSK